MASRAAAPLITMNVGALVRRAFDEFFAAFRGEARRT